MSDIPKEAILTTVTTYYLESGDFNGMSAAALADGYQVEWSELHDVLRELIEEERLGLLHPDHDLNTHILRLGLASKDVQIQSLADTTEPYHTCLYPRSKHLKAVVDRGRYEGKPYTLSLALGEAQLAYRSFDLTVLEFYRNDPRYSYRSDDINGHISIRDTEGVAERDQVLLESFGFSYNETGDRAVAVYLRYLADLTPEHQRIWHAKELARDYKLHPDYYRHTIQGNWGGGISIFTALLKELHLINRMAAVMGRPALFRQTFSEEDGHRPLNFTFLVRPTLEAFNDFALLLDKMLSDNINKDFFQKEVPEETETTRKDGKIVVTPKGTLSILDEWVRDHFEFPDWSEWDESIAALRKVRKLRQKPAHAVNENIFDQRYFKEQQQLMIDAYNAVNAIRILLSMHPAVKTSGIDVPKWLEDGPIWTQ